MDGEEGEVKVLTVIENYNPWVVGGAEVTIESYINYLSAHYRVEYKVLTGFHTKIRTSNSLRNISRTLFAVSDEKRPVILDVISYIVNAFTFIFTYISFRPDVVEFVPNNYSLYPLIFLSTYLKIPFVISVHNHSFSDNISSFGKWIEIVKKRIRLKVNSTQIIKVMTISEFMKKSLVKFGFDLDRVAVLHNPIEKVFEPTTAKNYAVFASRLIKEKGVTHVLKAFKKIKDLDLYVYGDGEQRKIVEEYSKKYPNIKYLGKVSENEVLESIRNSFCIIAHPIFEEPYGRYIIHSLSTLKPLVSTYSGAVSEIIKNNYTGLLIQKSDVEALIKSVKKLQNDPKFYKTIVLNLEKERKKFFIADKALIRLAILSQKI